MGFNPPIAGEGGQCMHQQALLVHPGPQYPDASSLRGGGVLIPHCRQKWHPQAGPTPQHLGQVTWRGGEWCPMLRWRGRGVRGGDVTWLQLRRGMGGETGINHGAQLITSFCCSSVAEAGTALGGSGHRLLPPTSSPVWVLQFAGRLHLEHSSQTPSLSQWWQQNEPLWWVEMRHLSPTTCLWQR